MTEPTPIRFGGADDDVELERAELYGLLATLWLAPPDEALLTQFRVAVTEAPQRGGLLETAWQDLVAALRATDAAAAVAEYDTLFGGVGKPEVFLYGSFYVSGFLNERPLALLRDELARLGLTRDADRGETEDHIAFLLEVMRYLIAGDGSAGDEGVDLGVSNLESQRRFFRAQLQPWFETLCDTVQAHPRAATWRAVASFTRAFLQVEAQAFDLLEA
ncbi:MAG: molecular chaperone TorD family protein [Rubrivivax sp.]|nr:molecular chaperone TorD family protein [Rubrivivax sp.]MDH5339722.1 molecular chaperone TorD family protein [Rubrivivax sp.]